MSFNVGSFINSAARRVVNRATSSALGRADQLLGGGRGYVGLAAGVLSSGTSLQTIRSIASMRLDQVLDRASDDFFARIGGEQASRGRNRLASTAQNATAKIESTTAASTMRYPLDLGTYCFAMQFSRYSRPTPLVAANSVITQTIYLPLPRELVSGHSISIATSEIGVFGTVADTVVQAANRGSIDAAQVASAAAAAGAGLVRSTIGDAPVDAVEQSIGAVPNPNISAAYRGPNLREYNFTWEFSPNNPRESKILMDILNEIQKRSLAAYAVEGSSAVLSYPDIVKARVLPDAIGQIGSMMKFKNAMIKTVNINLSPNGIPSFFKGTKAPTFIGLSISMQEIEYFVSSDYGGPTAGGFSPGAETAGRVITDFLTGSTTTPTPGTATIPENPPEPGNAQVGLEPR